MAYEKPIAIVSEDLAEGVYAASGSHLDSSLCESKYIQGNFQRPLTNTYGQTIFRKDRGCEGCPASQGGQCRIDLGPFGSPLMPAWERNGYLPDEQYVYWGD